mmetsp:Transcript_31358/g.64150  ORF Transcript_31358/g.64150 Transcript_31358/m.64150 type:complete len:82 (-) Transcript_31358:168-413(-)
MRVQGQWLVKCFCAEIWFMPIVRGNLIDPLDYDPSKTGLSIHDFSNILFTEAGKEFGLRKLSTKETDDLFYRNGSSEKNRK